MHLYLQAIGLSCIKTRSSLDKLIKNIIKEALSENRIMISVYGDDEKELPAQIKHYFNKVSGLSLCGTYNSKRKSFKLSYYFPFLDSSTESYETEVAVGRKVEKEAYNVLCDEAGRGIALIFHLSNPVEYRGGNSADYYNKAVRIAAMSNEGTILMPVMKSERQIRKCKAATMARNNLIDLAKKGDSVAMDNLTIEDLDTYSDIFKRIQKEDVLSIVDTTFMPSGFECDAYSVIGNITDVRLLENSLSGEKIYVLGLDCNDIVFDLCINEKSLTGIPEVGRRFRGRVWLQGQVEF